MTNVSSYQIMKRASTTYFTSAVFLPQPFRQHIYDLYAFVRTGDDFVDKIPQDRNGFMTFKQQTLYGIKNGASENAIIQNLIRLQQQFSFDSKYILEFLDAMESDLDFKEYPTYTDLTKYIHGSAEVIGILMSRLMNLPKQADEYAAKMGHSMQLINFIRDIATDLSLGRIYLPLEDRQKFEVNTPKPGDTGTQALIRFEIDRYRKIHREAVKGQKYIPKKYLKSIKTAADMYGWTADRIYNDPDSVFSSSNKPPKSRIVAQYLYNSLTV
jgi:15-cis-phytoene synthase